MQPEKANDSLTGGLDRKREKQLSTSGSSDDLHVAIIMDGNGRWALSRGLPRSAGHRAGASAVRRVVEAAPGCGIGTLTLFAFSSDNWKRPRSEVDTLMRLFQSYLAEETRRCVENGVRVRVIGRRDRLPPVLLAAIRRTERATRRGKQLLVRLAVDYSGRDSILRAATQLQERAPVSRETFSSLLWPAEPGVPPCDVDLLIRTGGEKRLSDFLLWECAYAELFFTPKMWPEFEAADLEEAVAEFHRRERRFGGVPSTMVG